ncbi:MAG: MMPL family transporter, partial [Thermoleophilaceae bacterium]|nr:MMPL family transporter [Thermoleophilaceae bacterium]
FGPARQELETLLVRYGYVGVPSLSNVNFLRALVLGAGTEPKERFNFLFPDSDHAVVLVRPENSLTDEQLRTLGDEIDEVVADTRLPGIELSVAGAPLVAAAVSGEVSAELLRLAPIVLTVMALALLGALRSRQALRSLLLAAGAALATVGIGWPLGLGLSPATVAALPVVLGLAVDFAVQLQVRFSAGREDGASPREAARAASAALAPVLGLATLAMAVGFMVLTLSPVPLVDRLGQTLAVGALLSVAIVLLFGPPLLAAGSGSAVRPPVLALPPALIRVAGRTRVLVLAGVVAVAGIALSGLTEVQSDLAELAPSGLSELERVESLQRELGTSGQLRIAITGDVTSPEALTWMVEIQGEVLALDNGLRPGPNLGELLLTGLQTAPRQEEIDSLLEIVPEYFLSGVLTGDRDRAELSFGVPLAPVSEQAELLSRIEPLLAGAPAGIEATPAGLIAVAADSVRELEAQRPALLLAAFGVVFLILLAARRNLERALLPLLPALLAAGISSLAIVALDIRLSPLSAGLEPLVLAVGVEFGLLLEARYREAREAGRSPAQAYVETYERVGTAVAVSAGTVALGFLVLVVSRLDLLRQFGLLVALELALCLAAAVLVVPLLAERLDTRRAGVRA